MNSSIVNLQNFEGQTPLHIAVIHGNEIAIVQLLAAGRKQRRLSLLVDCC
jgi:ankyrin repeat protein